MIEVPHNVAARANAQRNFVTQYVLTRAGAISTPRLHHELAISEGVEIFNTLYPPEAFPLLTTAPSTDNVPSEGLAAGRTEAGGERTGTADASETSQG